MEQFVKSVARVTTIDSGLEVAILLYYSIVTDDRESVTKSANKALSRPELHSVAGKRLITACMVCAAFASLPPA